MKSRDEGEPYQLKMAKNKRSLGVVHMYVFRTVNQLRAKLKKQVHLGDNYMYM